MDRWVCAQASCTNKSGHCYTIDGIHLRLLPQHLRTWSTAINEGSGDIETCPESLAKTLMPVKPSQKNPLRESNTKMTQKDIEVLPSHPLPYAQYPYGYYPYGPPPYPQPPPQPMPAISMASAPPATSTAPVIDHGHRSSSVISEGDMNDDKLTLYVDWLARKNPTLMEQLTQCLEKLKGVNIVFNTLSEVPDTLFDTWGFEVGIPLLLKSQMKKYERAKAKGRI